MMRQPHTPPERPFVVDCHAHILPFFGSAAGFASSEEHLLYIQRAMHTHMAQPVRRHRDHTIVRESTLWNPQDPTVQGRYDVSFRVARDGRFEWDKDGETYYIQFMPPTLQSMEAPAKFMINQMNYAGIDVVVLQNDHIYGSLNEYFADAIRTHPHRFIGLAQIEEPLAYQDEQIARLQHATETLGLRGLYYTTSTFFTTNYQPYYDHTLFAPFWQEVERLALPVFWVFPTSSPIGDFREEMRRFRGWYDRHPHIKSVLVHGVPDDLFMNDQNKIELPTWMSELLETFPLHTELLYPLRWGGRWDYPYPEAHERIRYFYDQLGPDKLLWGSDMPNVERYCTYRQTLTYLTDYCSFITPTDLTKILGHNTFSLFKEPFSASGEPTSLTATESGYS